MSAWMVSKAHIDALVRLNLEGPSDSSDTGPWDPPNAMLADNLGIALWRENIESLEYLYGEATDMLGEVPLYHYETGRSLTCAEAFKALFCYRYQSDNHKGWEGSAAEVVVTSLIEAVAHCVPGYAEAPWGID